MRLCKSDVVLNFFPLFIVSSLSMRNILCSLHYWWKQLYTDKTVEFNLLQNSNGLIFQDTWMQGWYSLGCPSRNTVGLI